MKFLSGGNADMRQAAAFAVLSCAFSWLIVGIFIVCGGKWGSTASLPVGVAFMLVPACVSFWMQKAVRREAFSRVGISFRVNRWWFLGWLLPFAVVALAAAVSLLLPGVEWTPDMAGLLEKSRSSLTPEQYEGLKAQLDSLPVSPGLLLAIEALFAGATVNALAAFGEEAGWRGFLQNRLSGLGFWKSSAVTGLVWGIWHAPIILQGHNYPEHPVTGVFMMIVFCLLWSPVLAWIRIRSGSVIAPSIVHGTINASAGLAVLYLRGGSDLTVGLTGLAGFIALVPVLVAVFCFPRKKDASADCKTMQKLV